LDATLINVLKAGAILLFILHEMTITAIKMVQKLFLTKQSVQHFIPKGVLSSYYLNESAALNFIGFFIPLMGEDTSFSVDQWLF